MARTARFKGMRSKGIRAPQVEYHAKLLEELVRGPTLSANVSRLELPVTSQDVPQVGKVSAKDSNYTDNGPYPMCCGNCKYIVWGQYDSKFDYCQIVNGSHRNGGIYPKGSCRYFAPKPFLGGAA